MDPTEHVTGLDRVNQPQIYSEMMPLYKDALYTILYRLGKPSSENSSKNKELYQYVQKAFGMSPKQHEQALLQVQSLQPPISCLKVTVKEAKEILGKDVSGFSDPYCLLGLVSYGESKDATLKRDGPLLRKQRKAVVKNTIPEDQIHRTSVKKQTLNPVWNETFLLEFKEIADTELHMDMWDMDEIETLGQKLGEITDLHGLKRIFKDAKKNKGQDDFLGNIVIKLETLQSIVDEWYVLEPRTETYPDRGKCHLHLQFIHKERDKSLDFCRPIYSAYSGLLKTFVQYEISSNKESSSSTWKGDLCRPAKTLLDVYATQNNLSPFMQDLAKWLAYSRLYQSMELDSNVLLHQLTSIQYQWAQLDSKELTYEQRHELGESLQSFLVYGLSMISKFRDIFPPKCASRLQSLLRILSQMCKMKAFKELNPKTFSFQEEITKAIQVGTKEWFSMKKGLHQPMMKNAEEDARSLARIVLEVKEDLDAIKMIWNKVFINNTQVDLFTVAYIELEDLIATELKESLYVETQISEAVADILFALYRNLKDIHQAKAFLQKRDKVLALTEYHVRFRDVLPLWVQRAYKTALQRVQRAVQVDQLKPLIETSSLIKHSSSVVDLATCFTQIRETWNQLSWPDPEEAFMVMVKITEDMCKIAIMYCTMLKQQATQLSGKSDHGDAANLLCVVVNNIEHLRTVLKKLPEQLDWIGLKQKTAQVITEEQFHKTLYHQLQRTESILNQQISAAVITLGQKLHEDIEKHILLLSNLHGLLPRPEEAVGPLMKFLEQEFHYMNENLVQENFNSLLAPLWTHTVTILQRISGQQVNSLEFYRRLQYALQCLEQCFHAEGNGMPLGKLHNEEYNCLVKNLELSAMSSHELIQKYLERKVAEQKMCSNEKYGAVTLIAFYNNADQILHIEILNAVNLTPMDSNGTSDPFINLSLEPKHLFPEIEKRTTKTKMCDLNPLFEETFEFLVSQEKLRTQGACLVLTVFDYDLLGSDDFEGEAFLSLRDLPGVGSTLDMGNIHQIRLALMHPVPNADNILKQLETRKMDRVAKDFVKLRLQIENKSMEV
ncbi:protein unc-13 homolog D isoform X1 [Polypterus senegalus]|uniref:protein unc-13 homolog D isoform X1 n=1 Tax=Polypterus senegalus TaxID=55291 RepID=UPI001965D1F2|nr:protein unc-13 homolog D isoform X1 [Polypterus senegalus]